MRTRGSRRPFRPAGWLAVAALAAGCAGNPYWSAQDRLTAERNELAERVAALQRQLDAERAEVARLSARLAELESAPRSVPEPTLREERAPAPSEEPLASPRPSGTVEASDLELAAGLAAGEPQLYDQALDLLQRQELDAAETAFRDFLARFPASDLADNAQYWIGEARLRRGDVGGALVAFRAVVEDYPEGNKVPEALFKVGHCLAEQGDATAAEEVLRELVRRYPGSAASELARRRLGLP